MKIRALAALLFFVTIAFFTAGYLRHFHGGLTHEFCHYAEIAANILSGKGFTTQTFYPSELAFLETSGINVALTHSGPVAFRFPLFAFWSAIWMKLAGVSDFGMALGNGVAHAVWVVTLFWVATRLFSLRVALVAACLWMVQPVMIAGFDLSGHPDVLFGWLFLIHSYFFYSLLNQSFSGKRPWLLLGGLAGLCYLTRQNFAFWIPLFLFLSWRYAPTNKKMAMACYLGSFALTTLPWVLYYYSHFHRLGNPLFFHELAESTVLFRLPWMEYRSFSWDLLAAPGFFPALLQKFLIYFGRSLKDLLVIWLQPGVFLIFLASLFIPLTSRFSFGRFTAVLLLWQLLAFAFLRHENMGLLTGRYFLWAAPLILLNALAFLEQRSPVFLTLAAVPLVLYWSLAFVYLPSRHTKVDWEEIVALQTESGPTDWIATNIPTQITWYAQRPTVNIPNTLSDFQKMVEKYPIKYVFLSSHRMGERENFPEWNSPPDGFVAQRKFAEGILYKRS